MAVQLPDAVMTVLVLVVILVLAPTIYTFIGWASSSADPLTQTLLALTVPALLIALILSVGRSARRGV
jgi:hypothetical protein